MRGQKSCTGDGAASVVEEVLGLKGSWGEAEALAPCGKSKSLKRGQKRIWLKVQQITKDSGRVELS